MGCRVFLFRMMLVACLMSSVTVDARLLQEEATQPSTMLEDSQDDPGSLNSEDTLVFPDAPDSSNSPQTSSPVSYNLTMPQLPKVASPQLPPSLLNLQLPKTKTSEISNLTTSGLPNLSTPSPF